MKNAAGFDNEKRYWENGAKMVVGIDEVGRGAWAGPVVAGAVVFPAFFESEFELYDSKILSPGQRVEIDKKIRMVAKVGIGIVKVPTINKMGIGKSTQKAFREAVHSLGIDCDYYLIDAFYIRYWSRENQLPIKKGDLYCASIAAASIVAKVYRDDLMRQLDQKYPVYGFATHKGYGTLAHQKALKKYSFSPIHRRSFNLEPILLA